MTITICLSDRTLLQQEKGDRIITVTLFLLILLALSLLLGIAYGGPEGYVLVP